MKPLKEDQQLRSVSLLYSVALQALKPKSSPRRRRGLDASTDRGLTERSGEVFLLDILSHRMSDMAIFQSIIALLCVRAKWLRGVEGQLFGLDWSRLENRDGR